MDFDDDGRTTAADGQVAEPAVRRNITTEVANAMVSLYKEKFGRGPTRARAMWCSDDVISVALEDTLTQAERTLAELDEHERLLDLRMLFQYGNVRDFCEPVERITGRTVRAFISGIDTKVEGLALETFFLHPAGYEGPSRIDVD